MRVFFYGTLMDRDVLRVVLGPAGVQLGLEPATLKGYRRVYVRGRTYPIVIRDPKGRVEGRLSGEIDQPLFDRLVAFEGDEYKAGRCVVVGENGLTCSAWVFVASPSAAPTRRPWAFETWRKRHKPAFLRRHRAAGA